MVKMNFNDICYAEAQGNYLVIFTMNGTYKTYLSISDLQSKLPEVLFARVHRSFIVALNKIERHNNSEIIIGDKKIPIGRSYISKVREILP
jgi:DNA-binding LytR/AlgR family response regulator